MELREGKRERSDADAMPSTIEYYINFLFSGLISLNHFVFCVSYITFNVYVIESMEEFKNYIEVNFVYIDVEFGNGDGINWSD